MRNFSENSIEGYVETVIFHNEENGYSVIAMSVNLAEVTCVGTLPGIAEGMYISCKGRYVQHPTYGEQFSIDSYTVREPHSREAFLRFVSSGVIPGIRKKNGQKIADRFGDDSYRIMLEEPETLAKEVKGISLNQAYGFQKSLVDNRQINDALIFLQGMGIGNVLAKKIYTYYGEEMYTILKENPYRLTEDIENVGFKTADEYVKRSGLKISFENRVRAACIYILEKGVGDGHCYLPADVLKAQTQELLGGNIEDFNSILTDLSVDSRVTARIADSGEVRVYLPAYFNMEQNVAVNLTQLNRARTNSDFVNVKGEKIEDVLASVEKESGIELDEKQKESVKSAMEGGVLVITGGPGTGKTTVINAIIRVFSDMGLDIKLAAPTGRASKRMSEACGMEACTIHRLLGYSPYGSTDDKGESAYMKFEYNAENKLDGDIVIIDEMSMVDLWLMNALLNALKPGTRLILVGDSNQLPSVGAGNVLGDIMDSGCFPVVRLEKIFRQARDSDIVVNAHKINKGEYVDLDAKSRDFLFIKRDDPDKIISAMYTLITDKLPAYVGAPVNEIQVLTPSKTSKTGVERLNRILQNLINPPDGSKRERRVKDAVFRVGDKVMQIKNDYDLEWSRYCEDGMKERGTGIYNGDIGVITEINTYAETLKVLFDDCKEVNYDFDILEELELAYAITIHKAQGSEYPAVVIPMYPAPRMLMNRKLLYTAVTRARKCVCMVGIKECFEQMEENIFESQRYSALSEAIRQNNS